MGMNKEVKIKSFEEYYKYYEGSGILPMLEDVYYTDYLNAIKYFKLLPKYEQLEKRTIKYKKQIYDRNKKLEGCRSQLEQYVLNNQKLQQQLATYKDREEKIRERIEHSGLWNYNNTIEYDLLQILQILNDKVVE